MIFMNLRIILFCMIIITIDGCKVQKSIPQVYDLRCEYIKDPVGLDVLSPRLSWKMKKDTRGARQTAYRIEVASTDGLLITDSPDIWDSGKIESDLSIQVEYDGIPLKSGMRVSWRVKIWDEENNPSQWSNIFHWEMGLIGETDWKAKWIGAPGSLTYGEWKYFSPLFRKEVNISKKIKSARAYISGLGYYELYINGEKIGDHVLSPNQTNYDRRQVEKWSEPRIGNMTTSVLYETYDITSNLKSGGNGLGIILGNGWYIQADRTSETSLWYNTPRLLAQFNIEYEDGSKELITSDESWKAAVSPILYNGLHTGEIYDARLEQKGWDEAGFDDSDWFNAIGVRSPTGKLKAQISAPDRVTKTIKPVSVTKMENGIYRFDMGQMISGWSRLKMSGTKGTEIKLRFKEELGPTYGQSDTFILKGEGTEIWEPRFTWHAFRYVDVSGSPSALTIENIEGRVVNTDVVKAGSFECSNKLLNQILENYEWTQLGNMHGGIPSDCPHRERRGYTGDGQISAKAAIYNFDMSQFYTKWLDDISDAQNHETGYVPNTAPYQDGGGGTAWGSAYIIIPWYMYQYYGDKQLLQQHYPGMKQWIEYMKHELNLNGILFNQGLGEWVPPYNMEIEPEFVNTCYYYYCCRLMVKISGILENAVDKDYFITLANEARDNINSTYLDTENLNYSVGEQGANVFPLGFGIVEKENINAVFENLIKNITEKQNFHFDTGILGTPLMLEVFTDLGRGDIALALMSQRDYPGFGYMIKNGATTIWETWQGTASHSHPMFGSVCHWFYQYLGGICPDMDNPGFKHTIIKPYPVSGLSFSKVSYQSMYGEIKSHWRFVDEDYYLNLTIPPNTSATVFVLAGNSDKVTESAKPVSNNPYVHFLKYENNYAVYEVESGEYQFLSKEAKSILRKPILITPEISPGDTLVLNNDSVLVSITSEVADAMIFFRLDSFEPDSTSQLYKKSFYVSEATIIKAKAFLTGSGYSFTKTSRIEFINPETNGLTYKYFEGIWTSLPDFSKLPVIKSGNVYTFGLENIIPARDEFALIFEGKIQIEKEGIYEFYINSNDGTCLFISNKLVVDNDGPHGAEIEVSGKIKLSPGLFPVRLNYFQAGGGLFLSVKYSGPGIEKQTIPASVLFRN